MALSHQETDNWRQINAEWPIEGLGGGWFLRRRGYREAGSPDTTVSLWTCGFALNPLRFCENMTVELSSKSDSGLLHTTCSSPNAGALMPSGFDLFPQKEEVRPSVVLCFEGRRREGGRHKSVLCNEMVMCYHWSIGRNDQYALGAVLME